jgi:hypothetical protein
MTQKKASLPFFEKGSMMEKMKMLLVVSFLLCVAGAGQVTQAKHIRQKLCIDFQSNDDIC